MESLSLKNKKKNYPLYEAKPFEDFRELLSSAAKDAGYETAFRFHTASPLGTSARSVTYAAFYEDVKALGGSLTAAGLLGSHTAVWAKNSYAYLTAFLTVLASPGVFLPVDAELPLSDAMEILRAGDARVLFLDYAFYTAHKATLARLTGLKRFIVFDMPAEEENGRFSSYNAFLEKGRTMDAESYLGCPLEDDELRMLVFPAGDTGVVRGVMFSQKNLRAGILGSAALLAPCGCSLSLLPFHLPTESVGNLLLSIYRRTTLCICPSPKSVMTDFKVFKPDSATLATLFVDNLAGAILSNLDAQGKRETLQKLIRTSSALRKAGLDRRRSFFSAVHEAFGGNLRRILLVGAPVRKETAEFFEAVGITLLSGYSISECVPMAATHRDLFFDRETAGVLLPGLEAMIDEGSEKSEGDGRGEGLLREILLRGDNVTIGYYNDPKATRAAFTDGGWLRTGDMGRIDRQGRLTVTGRRKNIISLKNGKTVYPEELESDLLNSPYIEEAVVYAAPGEGRDLKLCAELYLREETVRKLSADDRLALVKKEIETLNMSLPAYKRILQVRIRRESIRQEPIRQESFKKDPVELAAAEFASVANENDILRSDVGETGEAVTLDGEAAVETAEETATVEPAMETAADPAAGPACLPEEEAPAAAQEPAQADIPADETETTEE